MEKDYIKIYHRAFSKAEVIAEKEILKKFIHFEQNRRNANFAGNKISSDFYEEKQNSIVFQKDLQPLYSQFKNRLQEFPVKYQMDVITETLLPQFNKIPQTKNLSFETYITKLAIFNARDIIYNDFSNNRDLYNLMFKLNDFSEFFIKGCEGITYSRMYEKYRKIFYEKPPAKPVQVKIITDKEETKPNFYNIKDEYYEKFLSESFYDYLKSKFINEKQTTYQDFLAVFTINHNNHNKKIHFFCTTILASSLLYKLQKEIFYKLDMSKFAGNSLTTSKGGYLNGNNISQSKRNKSEMDERIVDKTIEYLKEIKISASKRE